MFTVQPIRSTAPPTKALSGLSSRPDLVERFPLILTCAKHTLFCESQHRALPRLRRQALDPEVELHPLAAEERGIGPGDWVRIETPGGSGRARARMNDTPEPNVVCGQHGWWQACSDIGMPGYDPFSPEGANLNLIIGNEAIDPVSGSDPHARLSLSDSSRGLRIPAMVALQQLDVSTRVVLIKRRNFNPSTCSDKRNGPPINTASMCIPSWPSMPGSLSA
jgi:Molydopterin dinucleotide binding domain